MIEELTRTLQAKEALIAELSGEKESLTLKVGELEVQVQDLHSSLLQKDKDVEVCAVGVQPPERAGCLQTQRLPILAASVYKAFSKHVLSASYPPFIHGACKAQLLRNSCERSNVTEFLRPALSLLLSHYYSREGGAPKAARVTFLSLHLNRTYT